jgi:hypothetical protein
MSVDGVTTTLGLRVKGEVKDVEEYLSQLE